MPVGEIAALAAACLWSLTSLCFVVATRRIGSLRVNLLRLPAALVLISTAMAVARPSLAPVTTPRLALLAASAILGLVLGDLAYFASLRRLGPRLALLLTPMTPVFAVVAGLALLGERPQPMALIGMIVTLAGIVWVIAERGVGTAVASREGTVGLILGVAGAACQGIGLALAKMGMAGELSPLAAAWVRMSVAVAASWGGVAAAGRLGGLSLGQSLRAAGSLVLVGAACGPFLGMWLSLVAARYTQVGVASTLMSTMPVLIIPLVMVTERYRPTVRAVVGAVVTVAGVALLFGR